MKRAYRVVAAALLAVSLAVSAGHCSDIDLRAMSHSKQPIKVFVKDFSNESGQAQVSAADFKKEVEKAFVGRKSVSFVLAKSPQESDVVVSAVIRGYKYMDKDPIKPSINVIMALDAVTIENYAELSADFTVTDSKTGSVLWQENVESYVKKTMTPAESLPMVYNKLARHFVAKAFGKGD